MILLHPHATRSRTSRARAFHDVATLAALACGCALCFVACEDAIAPERDEAASLALASDPVADGSQLAGMAVSLQSAGGEVTYLSLAPGSVPGAGLAVIRHVRTGATVAVAVVDGGFDPVAVPATPGDRLEIRITGVHGLTELEAIVPQARKPRVVRVARPRGKTDVVLNAVPVIVFSERVQEGTVTPTTVQLLRGSVAVSGQLALTADGLRASFQPAAPLDPHTEYALVVTTDIRDMSGDPLEESVTARFTTGTTTATAAAYTDPAGVYVVKGYPALEGLRRTWDFDATLHDDGRFTGTFEAFYPEAGYRASGSVLCFSTSGNTAWVAGIVEAHTKTESIGKTIGWLAIDNGASADGAADQLSLALVGLPSWGFTTPQEFCAEQPTSVGEGTADEEEIRRQDLESGDIVVTGEVPPATAPAAAGSPELAFVTWRHDPHDKELGEIYVMRADGSEPRRLTDNADADAFPAWSPDGSKIAFARVPHDAPPAPQDWLYAPFDLYVMNADGSGVVRLTHDGARNEGPAWSPDGARIAFSSRRSGDREIYVMNANGTGVVRLTHHGGHDYDPTWSPDGSRIAFASQGRGGRDYRIYVMNADGSGVTRLTDGGEQDVWPAWSPDGTRIAFVRGGGGGELLVVNTHGSGLRRLAAGAVGPPTWSPDGRYLAFTRPSEGIFVVSVDGSEVVRITDHTGSDGHPAWRPQ